ncbi:MAG: tetratricopeptide repeat protein, partial [Verrucomicrobia bacterium]|nr:tetratricopeptide repeat protein [Verrucomicrobiota bacterium]
MRTITARLLTMLFIMSTMIGNLYGNQPATNPANTATTGAPPRSILLPEDLLWSSAQECLKKAQYREAGEKFVQFAHQCRNDQRYREALFYQGLCELNLGQELQALNTWKRVAQLELPEKNKSQALLLTLEQMAGYYARKGQDAEQEKTLRQLQAEFPDAEATVTLHAQAAEDKLKKSDYAGALGFYQAVAVKLTEKDRKNLELAVTMTTKGAGNPRELLTAANGSFENNNVEQAIKLYQAFLKENSASPLAAEARTELGWSLYVQGKWQESEALWQDVIRKGSLKDKWVGQSRWHMIQLLMGPAGKPDKAIELCETQAKAFPNDPRGERALFIRAWLYWTQKQWVKAGGAFNDLLAAYPANAVDPPVQGYIRDCEQGIRDVS